MNGTLARWFYDSAYRFSMANWDNGQIPGQLARMVDGDHTRGRALDLGCGTGTQAVYLAKHGWTVVGVDLAPKAIEQARAKATQAGAAVDFRVEDVTHLDSLVDPFDLVLDLGCFHGLDAPQRFLYVQNLVRLTIPGSSSLLYALDRHGPFGVEARAEEVRKLFAPHFTIGRVESGTYLGGRDSRCYMLERQTT
jgi:2-polyprenyl-3-methyl-5-hydroxy-6-metoxy-1,4-benzoquinol methylase